MKKRSLFLGVLLASAVFSLAACTSSNSDATNDDEKQSDTSGDGGSSTTKESYTVTFNTNGGSTVANQTVEEGAKATQPTAPTKAETDTIIYTFGGWYTDSACTTEYDFNTAVTGDITLYAKWIENDKTIYYSVTFNTNGGTKVAAQDVQAGTKATEPTKPVGPGQDGKDAVFGGWYKDEALSEEFYFGNAITGDLTLYAKWIYVDEAYSDYTKIASISDLNAFRTNATPDMKYMLVDDIDLDGITLEATAVEFTGIFDGQGHSIKNAVYTDNAGEKSGILITKLYGGTVKNIKFENCAAKKAQETISIVAGLAHGEAIVSDVEFNGCTISCNNYAGFVFGRIDDAATNAKLSNITAKNGCRSTVTAYGGTLIGDINAGASATNRSSVTMENLDLDIQLTGSNGNGGFLSGRIRKNTNVSYKNVVIRNAELGNTATGLICGGGSNNAGDSTVTVENLYVENTNATLLQSCASQTGSNPVTTFSITYTNSYMNSTNLANITDNKYDIVKNDEGAITSYKTYLNEIDTSTVNVDWLKNTLNLDFTSENAPWTTEALDTTKYRLTSASTNVKSPDATISKLKGTTANACVRFEKGTAFTYDGLAITGVYSDGVNLVLKAGTDYTVDSSTYNKDVAGKYTITVKSTEDETKTYTYEVEVVELLSFEVDTMFAQTVYAVGDDLTYSADKGYTNLLVYGNWSDGQRLLFTDYTTNAESLSLDTAGNVEMHVSVTGFDDQIVKISVVGTAPIVVEDSVYINVDADADITQQGQLVDGVETFTTIYQAINYYSALDLDASVNKVIYIADGTYYEKITIPSTLQNVKIIGESKTGTIIEYDAVEDTYNPIAGKAYTMDCATINANGAGFGLENITVRNTFDYISDNKKYGNPQGFALTINADGAVVENCVIYGNQDTLFFRNGRCYLKNSVIEGNVDFIFGENTGIAFFDNCLINAVYRGNTNNTGYVTAMKGDKDKYPTYGYVFNNCAFTADGAAADDLPTTGPAAEYYSLTHNYQVEGYVVQDGSMSLGRPWGAGASVTMINCSFTKAYSTLAYGDGKSRWYDMSGNSPVNAHFAEYGSTGSGAITEAVTGGSVLTAEQAANYTAANTFAATNGGVKWAAAFDYQGACDALVAARSKVTPTGARAFEGAVEIGETYEIAVGDSVQLSFTSKEWNGSTKVVSATIADPSVATIENGVITGVATGTTTMTLTCGTATTTINISCAVAQQWTVTFDTAGGTEVASQTVYNKKYATEPTISKEGSVFKGWFKDAAYTEPFVFTEEQILADTTVYAKFVEWSKIYTENAVLYFNGTPGDGIDTFMYDNANSASGTYYGVTTTGKLAYRSANSDTQYNNNVEFSFAVEKYATITLTQKAAFDIEVYFNDTLVTPTINGTTVTYYTDVAGTIKFKNVAGGNKYLTSLSVTYPEVITESTKVTFGTAGNYKSITAFDYSGLTTNRENGGTNNQLAGSLVFFVEAGAIIDITSYSGYTSYKITVDGVTSDLQTGTSYSVTSANGGKVVITSFSDNNYFYNIGITYPTPISSNTTITFGDSSNIDTVGGVTYTATLRANGSNSQVSNGSITVYVEAGATVTVYGYGGSTGTGNGDYTSYNVTANGTTSETQTGDYTVTVTEAGKVVITAVDGNNYLMSIAVAFAE